MIQVKSIKSEECREWFLYKHYAKRVPSVSYSFGVYVDDVLEGICSYGRPVAHTLIKNAFNGEYQDDFLELNRLCVNDGLGKNVLSKFVSQTLNMLPKPKVIVSYADTSMGHNGYIYQATNWIYTGLSVPFKDYMVKGYEHLHSASVMDMVGRSDKNGHIDKVKLLKNKFGEENVYMVERPQKHRYFYLLGSKKQKKNMKKNLKYDILPYPKGQNNRYDSSHKPHVQLSMF